MDIGQILTLDMSNESSPYMTDLHFCFSNMHLGHIPSMAHYSIRDVYELRD